MLRIKPVSVVVNYLPLNSLFSWPDTAEIRVSFGHNNGRVGYILDSAMVLVENDIDTLAIQSELGKKQGVVPVNVEGLGPEMTIYVYHCFEHPDGVVLMCTGKPEPDDDIPGLLDMTIYTKQVWPPPETDT